jgi:lipid-A-disaccharide synthase
MPPNDDGRCPPATGSALGAISIFLIAVEESGDRLGAALMQALRQRSVRPVHFSGVGGRAMAALGLQSLHSTDDFSIIGFTAIPERLPKLLRYKRMTVKAVLAQRPDALITIDSPSYSLRVARSVRKADPGIPIIDYVSPTVWAWRPWRARKIRGYVDHILALLPFEPEVHRKLSGPPCTYVGHPLIEQVHSLRPDTEEAKRRGADPPVVLVLPGSRSGEVRRLTPVFGEAIAKINAQAGPIETMVLTMPNLRPLVSEMTAAWSVKPRVLSEDDDKRAAIRIARAALAKSGTVTLELALAGVPMVAAYKVSTLEAWVGRRLIQVPSVILANLALGEIVVPEFLQEACTPDELSRALLPLLRDGPERRRQIEAFTRLDTIMEVGTRSPATNAANVVLSILKQPAR